MTNRAFSISIPTQNIDPQFDGWTPKQITPWLEEWCRENLSEVPEIGWTMIQGRFSGFIVHFNDATAAVQFKLRWNGEDDYINRATTEPIRWP